MHPELRLYNLTMKVKPGHGWDGTPSQVARLTPKQRERTALLREFCDLSDLRNGSNVKFLINPEIVAEVEPFLHCIQDATCYRVVSKQEEADYRFMRSVTGWRALVIEETNRYSAWNNFLFWIQRRAKESEDGSVLVSLILCQPNSLVIRDLKKANAYVNLRSGATWDLHLIGYETFRIRPSVLGIPMWRFNAGRFLDVIAHIQHEYAAKLADSEGVTPGKPWRYSGTADLVSFMAYRDFPGLIDWPSLRAIQLLDAQGAYLDRSIGQIVEIMSDWREDDPEIREYAPGELRQSAISVVDLHRALTAVAGMVTSGIIGNAAYELLKKLLD